MSLPTTVNGVIARLREIDAELPHDDGVAVFNQMYLDVTERIATIITGLGGDGPARFRDSEMVAELDVRFANLWLTAYDASQTGGSLTAAWRPLFETRHDDRLPIQYALAGMNAHIEHDLPIAVVATCQARGLDPSDIHSDYEAVNAVLAQAESQLRRSFLSACARTVDDHVGPVVHLVSSWNIDKARDLAWVTAETIWALRGTSLLRERFLSGLSHTIGMTSRALLTPAA